MPAKHKCIWCGKLLFYEHKISIHLKYFGGLNAIRTNKQSKQKKGKNPELNRSEKGKGVESVDEGKEESSKKGKHYNKDKTFGAGSSTNKSEGVEYGSCNGKSTLHSVKWDRIILEELLLQQEASIGMTFVRMGFFTTNCMFDKFLNRLLVIPLSTLAGLSRSVIDYLFCQEPHSKLPDFLVFIIREHKGKIYEVIDKARAFVEVVRDATNFASADTIYGFAAYPSGENCLGNAPLVS
ncbi:uncharacterized protein LOC141705660 isoform X1 [Apium graveolens]|uniref:uncharacterized protein LOC141686921 isoform X1 n=1 Tax=Apium graveolens TaxID=4045 RepID=UPI003D79AC0E